MTFTKHSGVAVQVRTSIRESIILTFCRAVR